MQSYLEDIAEHPTAFRLEEFDEGVLQIGAPFYAYIYQDGELKSNSKIYYPICIGIRWLCCCDMFSKHIGAVCTAGKLST